MTLHVCPRCDGPCQCDPGLLENEARRWDGYEETPRRPLCNPNESPYDYGLSCRVEHSRDYSDREKVAHVKACGKACRGDFWYRHDYLNRFDPLDPRRYAVDDFEDRYPSWLTRWLEEEEWGEPPPERVQ